MDESLGESLNGVDSMARWHNGLESGPGHSFHVKVWAACGNPRIMARVPSHPMGSSYVCAVYSPRCPGYQKCNGQIDCRALA